MTIVKCSARMLPFIPQTCSLGKYKQEQVKWGIAVMVAILENDTYLRCIKDK